MSIGILAASCSTSLGPTREHLWRGLISGLDGRREQKNLGPACLWPDDSNIHAELDRAFAAIEEIYAALDGPVGVIFASTKGQVEEIVYQDAPSSTDPIWPVLQKFTERHDLRFSKQTCVSNACASFTGAVYLASRWLKRGDVDHVLILSADGVGPFVYRGFQSLGLVTQDVCRPFAKNRSGLTLGEAAAAVLLSRAQSDYEMASVAIDSEGSPVARPSTAGASLLRVCKEVLAVGTPDAIIAHGTGTLLNDQIEDQVLGNLFSRNGPSITGTKWSVGHTLGASGAVDFIAGLEVLKHQRVFSLMRTPEIDDAFIGNYLTSPQEPESYDQRNVSRKKNVAPLERILLTSLGFGGMHGAMILKRRQ